MTPRYFLGVIKEAKFFIAPHKAEYCPCCARKDIGLPALPFPRG